MSANVGDNDLTTRLVALLGETPASDAALQAALDGLLDGFACIAGTIHRFNPQSQLLELAAHRGIPEAVRERAARVPIGKGMAGIAAERREAVQVCNLQTDESGVARPGARETPVAGAITVPMLVDGRLCGTVGIAKSSEYEFQPEETVRLLELARLIGERL